MPKYSETDAEAPLDDGEDPCGLAELDAMARMTDFREEEGATELIAFGPDGMGEMERFGESETNTKMRNAQLLVLYMHISALH